MSVYSTLFVRAAISTVSQTSIYTFPASFTGVLRSFTFADHTGAANNCAVLATVSGPTSYTLLFSGNVAAYSTWYWEGRIVFNAGDQLEVILGGPNGHVSASGYLL